MSHRVTACSPAKPSRSPDPPIPSSGSWAGPCNGEPAPGATDIAHWRGIRLLSDQKFPPGDSWSDSRVIMRRWPRPGLRRKTAFVTVMRSLSGGTEFALTRNDRTVSRVCAGHLLHMRTQTTPPADALDPTGHRDKLEQLRGLS